MVLKGGAVRRTGVSDPADPYRVEAVDRAMVLLSLLLERDRLGASEAAAELGVAPSTAHRLLTTMAHRGYVVQGARRQYHPGPRLVGSRVAGRSVSALVGRVRPVLQELHDAVGETAHLAVLTGPDVQFADGLEGRQTLRVGLRIGSRIPAYCSSGGKAMLAALPTATVDAIHAAGLRSWSGRKVRMSAELHRELDAVRERGYGVNRGESERGVVAIGVAVGLSDGEPLAGLSVAIPAARFDDADEPAIVERLLAAQAAARRAPTPA